MSIRTLKGGFLFLLGALALLPACNPVPVMLVNFTNLPPDSARINIVVSQGSNVGKAIFQREDMTNKWLPMESMTKPPAPDCPPTTTVAMELPRGVDGSVTLKIGVDPPIMGGMGGMTGMVTPVAGACVKVDFHDGALNEVTVPLLPTPPPCP